MAKKTVPLSLTNTVRKILRSAIKNDQFFAEFQRCELQHRKNNMIFSISISRNIDCRLLRDVPLIKKTVNFAVNRLIFVRNAYVWMFLQNLIRITNVRIHMRKRNFISSRSTYKPLGLNVPFPQLLAYFLIFLSHTWTADLRSIIYAAASESPTKRY